MPGLCEVPPLLPFRAPGVPWIDEHRSSIQIAPVILGQALMIPCLTQSAPHASGNVPSFERATILLAPRMSLRGLLEVSAGTPAPGHLGTERPVIAAAHIKQERLDE